MNPYAPTTLDGNLPVPARASIQQISGRQLITNTITYVSLSGGIFGGGLVFTIFIVTLVSTFGLGSSEAFAAFLLYGLIAIIVGIVIAFVASLIIVPLLYLAHGGANHARPHYWDGRRVRIFGSISGFLSGWCPIAFPSMLNLEPWGFVAGLVPGAVGTVLTFLMTGRTARIANEIIHSGLDDTDEAPKSNPLTGDPLTE